MRSNTSGREGVGHTGRHEWSRGCGTAALSVLWQSTLHVASPWHAFRSLGCEDIEFSPEDAGRSERAFLYEILGEVIKVCHWCTPSVCGWCAPSVLETNTPYGVLAPSLLFKCPHRCTHTTGRRHNAQHPRHHGMEPSARVWKPHCRHQGQHPWG